MRFRTISVGLAVVAGVLLTTAVLRSQAPAVGPVWELAMVTQTGNVSENGRSMSSATICYASASGCRIEKVRTDVKDFSYEPEAGLVAASAKLGEKGWELASATETSGDRSSRTLYFRRLRGAINRSDWVEKQ